MKKNVTRNDFVNEFAEYGRGDQFSEDALDAIYEYIVEVEEDTGEEFELDVIAICCDFTEYESLEELQEYYSDIESMEDLSNSTMVIEFGNEGQFVIQDF